MYEHYLVSKQTINKISKTHTNKQMNNILYIIMYDQAIKHYQSALKKSND